MATSDNLVFQFSTGTGTGNLTLQNMSADSPAQYFRTFSSAFGTGVTQNVFYYCIRHRTTLEWEVGTGHMSDATTLVRDTVLYSSNSNNAVNFSAGSKDVISDIPANLQSLLATIASTYVPYSGATAGLDLGAQQLNVHNIRPDGSDGLLLESNNGTDIAILGAGNTANVTWYGNHNFDTATASTIASFGASKTLSSLSTSTYPSLTELSYVKGVTSAIQTQLDSHTAHDDILFYGDGSDGNVTISGSVTLTRDMFYNNLTITTGAALDPAGYRIFVKGTLDLTSAPAAGISRTGANGSNATGSSGASAGSSNSGIHVGGGIGGGNGGSSTNTNGNQGSANTNPANMIGGLAGNGGKGGDSAAGTGGAQRTATDSGGNQWQTSFRRWTDFLARAASIYNGGSGGPGGSGGAGSGSASNGGGGGGGAGGGVLWISARTVTCAGATAASIQAKGGDGGNGRSSSTANAAGGGGGAGAGGGFIFFAYKTLTGSASNIFNATGGNGGNGGNGNGTGNGGDGGHGGDGGAILILNMAAGTTALTQGSAGSTSGTAGSGTTGGTGASGGSCVASL